MLRRGLLFFRNTIVSGLLFSLVFLAIGYLLERRYAQSASLAGWRLAEMRFFERCARRNRLTRWLALAAPKSACAAQPDIGTVASPARQTSQGEFNPHCLQARPAFGFSGLSCRQVI